MKNNTSFPILGAPRTKQDAEPRRNPSSPPQAPPASSDLESLKTASGRFSEMPTTEEAHERRKTMPPHASGPRPAWLHGSR